MSGLFTSGLWASGELLGQRVEASYLQRMDSQDPEAGQNRTPSLWSVLGSQAGHEGEVRTEHPPSLGHVGGPGQVTPHVGSLSAFCSDSGFVLSFPAVPQGGWTGPCQENSGQYKGAPRGSPTAQLEGPFRFQPSYQQRRVISVPVYPRGAPSISDRGAPGTRRLRQRSMACVHRSENRGGSGSTRSQGEEGALSVHQGLPIPAQRGIHKALIPPAYQPQNLTLC